MRELAIMAQIDHAPSERVIRALYDLHSRHILKLQKTSPAQAEFYQAVEEVLDSLQPVLESNESTNIMPLLSVLSNRTSIMFRVPGSMIKVTYRSTKAIVSSSTLRRPYKGGLRFHRSVNASIIKFLDLNRFLKCANRIASRWW